MFIAVTIDISWSHPITLNPSGWVYIHAAICKIISDADADLGKRFHDDQRHKHMTMAIIRSMPRQAVIRLTFLTEMGMRYLDILTNYCTKTPVLRVGQHECHIDAIQTGTTRWTQIASWADLCAPVSGHRLAFEFLTPMAIMQRNAFGKRITQLLPEPTAIFKGLAQRWAMLGGPSLPEDLDKYVEGHGCVVSQYSLASTKFRIKDRTQIGGTGTIIYECIHPSQIHIAALCQLAKLANFSGVGYQTVRGMGATIVSIQ